MIKTVASVALVLGLIGMVSAGGVSISSPSEPECYNITGVPPCTEFIMCIDGTNQTMPCPSGLLYNNDTYQCDYAHLVDNTTCSTASGSSSVCSTGAIRATPNVGCVSFDVCVFNNWTYTINCPSGTLYSTGYSTCFFEDYVDTSDCGYLANECSTNALRPTPGSNCAQFQQCLFGVWSDVNITCAPGTLFNNETQSCALVGTVNTTSCDSIAYDGVDCTGVNSSTPITASGDCTSYYYCFDEYTPIQYNCTHPLLFNRNVSYCDNFAIVDTSTCYQLY